MFTFEDLNQFYMEEHYQQSNGEHLMQHNFDQQQHLINDASAELLLYQQESSTAHSPGAR
jgi:hypothetical protein